MTSLLSFSTLVDGAAAPVSETFEKLQPLHRQALVTYSAVQTERRRSRKRKSPIDAYLQIKSLWIDTIGKIANPFVTMKRPMTKAAHFTSRTHGSRA